jgi:hypothetical protein
MKKLLYVLAITTFLGCNNERVLLLPEIENAEVTEVLDVSPVYIFYDETQPDSTLFNRKNLIGTTNWLVNVDRRLTLRQAIPHIQYLQNKRKKESMHKNEDAKNYFTCNDTSINNLGFLEFTHVNYSFDNQKNIANENSITMAVESLSDIRFSLPFDLNFELSKNNLYDIFTMMSKNFGKETTLKLSISKNLSFGDYIYLKSILSDFDERVSKDEFIY